MTLTPEQRAERWLREAWPRAEMFEFWSKWLNSLAAEIRAAVEEALGSAALAEDCMAMIHEDLKRFPCLHGEGHDAGAKTPPMMYPEWLACIRAKAVEEEREACAEIADRVDIVVCSPSPLSAEEHRAAGRAAARWIAAAIRERGETVSLPDARPCNCDAGAQGTTSDYGTIYECNQCGKHWQET